MTASSARTPGLACWLTRRSNQERVPRSRKPASAGTQSPRCRREGSPGHPFGAVPNFGTETSNIRGSQTDTVYESMSRPQTGATRRAADMEGPTDHLIDIQAMTHTYAAQGYRPIDVHNAVNNFVTALGIEELSLGTYRMNAVELACFQLYLVRHCVALRPEIHELRVAAVAEQVLATMERWGDTEELVIQSLGLDVLAGQSYEDLVRLVEDRILYHVQAVAISFGVTGITVDGVAINYPLVVGYALLTTAGKLVTTAARSPF